METGSFGRRDAILYQECLIYADIERAIAILLASRR